MSDSQLAQIRAEQRQLWQQSNQHGQRRTSTDSSKFDGGGYRLGNGPSTGSSNNNLVVPKAPSPHATMWYGHRKPEVSATSKESEDNAAKTFQIVPPQNKDTLREQSVFMHMRIQGDSEGVWWVPTERQKMFLLQFLTRRFNGAEMLGPWTPEKGVLVGCDDVGVYYMGRRARRKRYLGLPSLQFDPSGGLSCASASRSTSSPISSNLYQQFQSPRDKKATPYPQGDPSMQEDIDANGFDLNVVVNGYILPKYHHYAIDERGPHEERVPFVVSKFGTVYELLLTNNTHSHVAFQVSIDEKAIILGNGSKLVDPRSNLRLRGHEEFREIDDEACHKSLSSLVFTQPPEGRLRSTAMGKISAVIFATRTIRSNGGVAQTQSQTQEPLRPDPSKSGGMATRSGVVREYHYERRKQDYRPVKDYTHILGEITLLYRHEEVLEILDLMPQPQQHVRAFRSAHTDTTQRLQVREMRYTHDTIQLQFADGTSVRSLINDLCDGRLNLQEWTAANPIEVVYFQGHWRCLNNRRLYAMKQYVMYNQDHGAEVIVIEHPANERFHRANTTQNEGIDVQIRN